MVLLEASITAQSRIKIPCGVGRALHKWEIALLSSVHRAQANDAPKLPAGAVADSTTRLDRRAAVSEEDLFRRSGPGRLRKDNSERRTLLSGSCLRQRLDD